MANDVEPGSDIAGYILERQLGGGGFGAVWRARDSATGDIVAVKLLTGTFSENTGGLRADIELLAATASSRSEHVVKVLGGGSHPIPHVVMEFIDGSDLAARLREGVLSPAETIHIGLGVADALHALEGAGIVHRDVKPANVMLDNEGVVKLTDFGIAKIVGYDTITMTGQLPMTMAYAAPEVWEGTSTHRSDLYALGVLLYQCLRGSPPFVGNYGSLFKQHTTDQPDLDALPLETPPSLREMIRACMEKDPDSRPRDGLACIELLHQATAELTAPAAPEPERFGPWIRQRRHPVQPWAWRCVHQDTGEPAVVEVHASDDVHEGARLREAVAANTYLAPLGAEKLLGTNRVLLRPGESWHEPPSGDMQFWVARQELQAERPPDEVTVPRLRRAVDALLSLVDVAATQGIALSLAPTLVSMRGDGSVHVKRPGLVAPDADPLEQGLAFLRNLPLDEDARALVTDAPDLRTLRSWLPIAGSVSAAGIGMASVAEGAGDAHTGPDGTTLFTAPILRDETSATIPAYAPLNAYEDAPPPPVKRGWFHAGVRVARMYLYVGAGVTMLSSALFVGAAYAAGWPPFSPSSTTAFVLARTTSPTPRSTAAGQPGTPTLTADGAAFIAAIETARAGGSPVPVRTTRVAGEDATPRAGETRAAREPTQAVAVVPPGASATDTPTVTTPPVVDGNEATPTPTTPPVAPSATNTPSPTPTTPVQALGAPPSFGSGVAWQEFDRPPYDDGAQALGPAMSVCLNANNPPPTCSGYSYNWSGDGWGIPNYYQAPDRFKGARWIFSSTINRATATDTKTRYFRVTFNLTSVPTHARFYMMADNVADVWLNFQELVWDGNSNAASNPLAVDVYNDQAGKPHFVVGENNIAVLIENSDCGGCDYQHNPAGFIIGNPFVWE